MKTTQLSFVRFALMAWFFSVIPAHSQNTLVTSQGRVASGGMNFNGSGQFKFALVTSTNFNRTARATPVVNSGFITSYNVTDGGNGYVSAPIVTISGGGGSGAAATANLSGGSVSSLSVDNPGSGYNSGIPTVSIAPPPPNISYTTFWSNDGTSNAGSEPASAITVAVTNGLFTVALGDTNIANMTNLSASIFTQPNLQLRIWFNDGVNGFAALNPAQNLTTTPYSAIANHAALATSANNLLGTLPASQISGSLPASQISGTLPASQISGSLPASQISGSLPASQISGFLPASQISGSLPASQISGTLPTSQLTGTFPADQLSGTIPLAQLPGGIITNNQSGLTLSGTFSGRGTLSWQVAPGTTQQAQPNTGYLLTNDSLVTVTLPSSPNVGDVIRVVARGTGGWKIAQNAGQSVFGDNRIGEVWTPHEINRFWYALASSADGTKLVAAEIAQNGFGGLIYTSTDSGLTWAPRDSIRIWSSIASSADGTKLVASTYPGLIFTSTNSGLNWTGRDVSRTWNAVASSADGTKLVAVVENGGLIYTSVDSGVTWTPRPGAPAANWYSVASSADGTRLIAGPRGGQIHISTDSGTNWTARETSRSWRCVASSADGMKLVAGASAGQIFTSTNGGVDWVPHDNPRTWHSVASSADGTKLVAGVGNNQIFTSIDSGASWIGHESNREWRTVAASADGNRLVAAAYGGQIYTSVPSGISGTTAGVAGYLLGGQNAAIELQYIGNGQFIPISHSGTILASPSTPRTRRGPGCVPRRSQAKAGGVDQIIIGKI